MMIIGQEAVVALAKHRWETGVRTPWDEMPEGDVVVAKELREARMDLETAAPHLEQDIRASVLEEVADAVKRAENRVEEAEMKRDEATRARAQIEGRVEMVEKIFARAQGKSLNTVLRECIDALENSYGD